MGQFRLQRLGEQLREEIATMILRHEIKDPRVNEFLSVNRVEVAADLAYAKVYVSSFMDDQSVVRGVEGLKSAAGFIQCRIAKKLTIYKFPKLTFVADFSMKEGYKMVQKLNALEAESKEREQSSAADSGTTDQNDAE